MGNKSSKGSTRKQQSDDDANPTIETTDEVPQSEAKTDHEVMPSTPSTLDIAFVLDCTASMNPYITSCKENINIISTKIKEEVKDCDVHFALTMYRDIPPMDHSFITKTVNFTPYPFQIKMELDPVQASGGGDGPECLTSALYCCSNLKWRKDAIKIMIVITDAPPHGLEKKGKDHFPDGDPDTFGALKGDEKEEEEEEGGDEGVVAVEDTMSDPMKKKQNEDKDDVASNTKTLNVISIIERIRDELGATIYSIGCEPDLSMGYDFAIDFMRFIAEYTKGRFLPLSSADLLPEVIVGSVKQQIRMKHLKENLDAEIVKIKEEFGDDISSDKLNQIIMEKFKAAGIRKKEIGTGTLYKVKRPRDNVDLLMNGQKCRTLSDFKAQCKALGRLRRSDFRHLDTVHHESDSAEDESHEALEGSMEFTPSPIPKGLVSSLPPRKISTSDNDCEFTPPPHLVHGTYDHAVSGMMRKVSISSGCQSCVSNASAPQRYYEHSRSMSVGDLRDMFD